MKNDIRIPSIEELIKKPKPKKPKDAIKNRIAEILEKKQMTQMELSDLTGLYPSHLSEIINGKRKHISLSIALNIAETLGVELKDIFYKNKNDKNKTKKG
jgi:DNA-binding Xre family transcriptional regulator